MTKNHTILHLRFQYIKRFLLVLVCLLCIPQLKIYCQSFKQSWLYAEQLFEEKQFAEALVYYEKAMNYEKQDLDIVYKYALTLKENKRYAEAAKYLKKITKKDKRGRRFIEAHYHYAEVLKFLGEYDLALIHWQKSRRALARKSRSLAYRVSKKEIHATNYAIRAKGKHSELTIKEWKLPNNEFASTFSPWKAHHKLIFTGAKYDEGKSYASIYEADSTMQFYPRFSHLQEQQENWSNYRTINGLGFVTKCDSALKNCSIWRVNYSVNGAQKWTKLPDNVNFGSINTQAIPVEYEERFWLFFVSNGDGTLGGLDIWKVEMDSIGQPIGHVVNLGRTINTIEDEVTPFYDTLQHRLYFSSSWHNGFGGHDVFFSEGKPSQQFQRPINLGSAINSSLNDLYFIKQTEERAYFTSNRFDETQSKNKPCCNKVYEVTYPVTKKIDTITQRYATLDELNNYLPVKLYFHNDEPNPRTKDTLTQLDYLTTYQKYKQLKKTYLKNYSRGKKGDDKQWAEQEITDFFEDEAEQGVDDLHLFSDLLVKELEKGLDVELSVRGFASPLAKSDYNVNLTLRRISALENFLRNYQKGVFIPYFEDTASNGGRLTINRIPFGEYTSGAEVSDEYKDQQNSVYSPHAAFERKIEIQSVSRSKDKQLPKLEVDKNWFDFGLVNEGDSLVHEFELKNTGVSNLIINRVKIPLAFVSTSWNTQEIAAQNSTVISIGVSTEDLDGKYVIELELFGNQGKEPKKLVLTFEVL